MSTENTENKPARTKYVVPGPILGVIDVVALFALGVLLGFLGMNYAERMAKDLYTGLTF